MSYIKKKLGHITEGIKKKGLNTKQSSSSKQFESYSNPGQVSSLQHPSDSEISKPAIASNGGEVPPMKDKLKENHEVTNENSSNDKITSLENKEDSSVDLFSMKSLALPSIDTNPHRLHLKHFEIHRTLGTGSFGRVHLVKYLPSAQYFAMKVLKKSKVVELKQVEHTINERNILARIHHPFLVQLVCTFQDSLHLYMILEYVCGGELFTILRRAGRFANDIAKFYAAEVTLAFDYLHKQNIIYRDLKPENILLNKDGHMRLTDFGFAKIVPEATRTLCGTPEYLAPEVIRSKDYGKAVDWYSLGVLIYEMLIGSPPYYHENHVRLYELVLEGNLKFPSSISVDPLAVDLIQNLLQPDVTKRYGNLKDGSDDIKNHPWFSGVNWEKLYHLQIRPPYIPKISSDGDTRHFEFYPEEKDGYNCTPLAEVDPYSDVFASF